MTQDQLGWIGPSLVFARRHKLKISSGHVFVHASIAFCLFVSGGTQSQCIVEEFSRSAASQQSCKKVRFAEKESVEVFNQSKLSVTPLPKGQLPSSVHHGACLRSVLKKCPVKFTNCLNLGAFVSCLGLMTCPFLETNSK